MEGSGVGDNRQDDCLVRWGDDGDGASKSGWDEEETMIDAHHGDEENHDDLVTEGSNVQHGIGAADEQRDVEMSGLLQVVF